MEYFLINKHLNRVKRIATAWFNDKDRMHSIHLIRLNCLSTFMLNYFADNGDAPEEIRNAVKIHAKRRHNLIYRFQMTEEDYIKAAIDVYMHEYKERKKLKKKKCDTCDSRGLQKQEKPFTFKRTNGTDAAIDKYGIWCNSCGILQDKDKEIEKINEILDNSVRGDL